MFERLRNFLVWVFQRINKLTGKKLTRKKTRRYINHQNKFKNTDTGLLNWFLRKCKFVICSKQINKSKNMGS